MFLLVGKCNCEATYTNTDCSVQEASKPYIASLPGYGLCDTMHMDCTKAVLYGQQFADTDRLTCFLQEV